jgi:membrane protein YdbS with pleckstrin-like domain
MLSKENDWKILDPAAKKVWRVKGAIFFAFILLLDGLVTSLIWLYDPMTDYERNILFLVFIILTSVILVFIVIYNIWIKMYYKRYKYALDEEGILINRGVWWKYKRTIPFPRMQHISIDQGPIEQIYGLYRVNSYTAGTGSIGGASAGSRATGPEGQILGVRNPVPLKDEILKRVMKSRLGDGVNDITSGNSNRDILAELKAIRKVLEKK